MALDLTQIALQVQDAAGRLQAGERQRAHNLELAEAELARWHADPATLRQRIRQAQGLQRNFVWHPPRLHEQEPPGAVHPLPAVAPGPHTVIATDGSQIERDRHRGLPCYVLNVGWAVLRYGAQASAELGSAPDLRLVERLDDDEEAADGDVQQVFEGGHLAVERTVAETRKLADLAERELARDNGPVLALADGTLVPFVFLGSGDALRPQEHELLQQYVAQMARLRRLAETHPGRLLVAGYISLPGSTNVVDALRLGLCPHDVPDCRRLCPTARQRPVAVPCGGVAGVHDRHLFDAVLPPDARSALFEAQHRVFTTGEYHEADRVWFFYVRAGAETVRIEVPRWLAQDAALVEQTHLLTVAHAALSPAGYPAALMEAHEQAAVSPGDKERFWELVSAALAGRRLPEVQSAKAWSKRTRWI